jgi:hypothetical protein
MSSIDSIAFIGEVEVFASTSGAEGTAKGSTTLGFVGATGSGIDEAPSVTGAGGNTEF